MTKRKPHPLIAFCGRAQSGKSTAAKYLKKNMGYSIYSFAEPLRKILRAMGVPQRNLNSDKESVIKEFGCSARFLMQTLGTNWAREMVKESIWRDMMEARLVEARKKGILVSIDDVRFNNEADLIHAHGGLVIGIDRGGTRCGSDHPSEKGISYDLVDMVIENDGSVTDLSNMIGDIANDRSLLPR